MQPVGMEKGVKIKKKASSMFCGPWEESAERLVAVGLAGSVNI